MCFARSMVDRDQVRAKLDEIIAEMKRARFWDVPPPPSTTVTSAFGHKEMAFEQWLRWVFVPRVEEAIATGRFPPSSQVGIQATREADTEPGLSSLAALLNEFDELF